MTDPIETRKSLWYRVTALRCSAQADDAEIEKLRGLIASIQARADKSRHDADGLQSAAERLQIIDEAK